MPNTPNYNQTVGACLASFHEATAYAGNMGPSTMPPETLSTDFLVLGSGIAGLRAALTLARSGSVLVVTKDQPTESNTGYAQGGIAVAMGTDDDPSLHLEDTLHAGA